VGQGQQRLIQLPFHAGDFDGLAGNRQIGRIKIAQHLSQLLSPRSWQRLEVTTGNHIQQEATHGR